jgi:hypothetical protein
VVLTRTSRGPWSYCVGGVLKALSLDRITTTYTPKAMVKHAISDKTPPLLPLMLACVIHPRANRKGRNRLICFGRWGVVIARASSCRKLTWLEI